MEGICHGAVEHSGILGHFNKLIKGFSLYIHIRFTGPNITEALGQLNNDNKKYYEAGYAIHELAIKAWDIYQSEKATVDDKRLLLYYVFSNITLNKGKARADYTPAYDFLATWMPIVNNFLEPSKKPSVNEPFSNISSQIFDSRLPRTNNFLEPQVMQVLSNDSLVLSSNSEQCSRIKTFANF